MSELKYPKQKDLTEIRKKLHKEQNNICPILRQEFPVEDMVVDHQHMKAGETIGENGAGLIRGVIHRQANVLEGKLINAFYRYGLHKFCSPVEFLLNLAEYLKKDKLPIVHPLESLKIRKRERKKLQKNSYNKLLKKLSEIGYNAKIPEYPKNGYMDQKLNMLFKKVDLPPEYYK